MHFHFINGEGVRSIAPGGLAQHPHMRTCTMCSTCAAPVPYPVPMLTKSGCATTCVATHCAKLLAQQINATCQLPVELCPCLWCNTNKNNPLGK